MPITRVFLGWKRPGLLAAVDWLIEQYGQPGMLDLSGVIVVVPGGRAGRRLLEILVQRAEGDGHHGRVSLSPPQIATIGRLPELLYPAKQPFADELTQQLAWVSAVRQCDPTRLRQLIAAPPADGDLMGWLALAEMLARLHRELAAEVLGFADVAERGPQVAGFTESERWQILAEIQAYYLLALDRLGLWDVQTARRLAIQFQECRTESQVVLVGMADMNRAMRQMLDLIAPKVTALVLAPAEVDERFDPHGCVRPEAWQEAKIDLGDEQLELVDDPADQAAAAVRALAALDGRYSGEDITIGVPDAQVVPYLQQYLGQASIPVRHGAGLPITESGPYRLLAVLADYLEQRRFACLASLVRHPAVQTWLEGKLPDRTWLTALDEYQGHHLPAGLDELWLGATDAWGELKAMHEQVRGLFGGLGGQRRPLGDWGEAIGGILVAVFGGQPLNPEVEPDRTVLAACGKIHKVLAQYRSVPGALAPEVTGAEGVRLVLRELEGELLTAPTEQGAIELLGWLELALDDAPVLVVTGFNEGIVPGSRNADLFLPNQLRLALGVEDNDRRYARDAYALSVLAASRAELKVIVGRRTSEGDPLTPSRLLFTCEAERLAPRALRLFSAESLPGVTLPGALQPGGDGSAFEPRRPPPLAEPVRSMRVTEFRDYIACPYRYYLRHRLKLAAIGDDAEELDGGAFGSLAHSVLCEFGQSRAAASSNPEVVYAHLSALLDQHVAACYGAAPLSSIRVQAEQLRLRLKAFAGWQANWAAQGWRIKQVEVSARDTTPWLVVDGQPMYLRGRIDRIDRHSRTGDWILFDYKTSDHARTPDQKHRVDGEWIDLQLPLYRHLAAPLGIKGKIAMGYIVLPKDVAETGCLLAEWTEDELAAADDKAEEIMRAVQAQKFWPPVTPPPAYFEEFSAICLDQQFGYLGVDDEDGEDDEEGDAR